MEALLALGFGFVLFAFALVIGIWVFSSLAHMKALRMLGYANPWFAWIPFLNYVAYVDAIQEGDDITIFGQQIPVKFFRFWWIVCIVVGFVPVVGTLLTYAVQIICLGTCYIKMYSRLELKSESDVQVVGYVSGLITIVAAVKFMMLKESK